MATRTKRIFISDIHMGDERSMNDPNHYGWFRDNIPVLAKFLDDQLHAPDVKEVIILGDLFDTWVIPVDKPPLTKFEDIYSNPANKDVIDKLKALAADSDIKLIYVPGNHDMAMDIAGISSTKQFMENNFRGIHFICDSAVPWGKYTTGTLAAEHGNHYCLFNAPDMWTAPKDTFLPLGYFISRIAAYNVSKTGTEDDSLDVLAKFFKDFKEDKDSIEAIFEALVQDAGLKQNDNIDLTGVPGYSAPTTMDTVKNHFSKLIQDWKEMKNIKIKDAIQGDALEDLSSAANLAYFNKSGSNTNIVIFGHTHCPYFTPIDPFADQVDPPPHDNDKPWTYIYANCGSWIDNKWLDKGLYGCTYVETEEDSNNKRHYVRLKTYSSQNPIGEGFVGL